MTIRQRAKDGFLQLPPHVQRQVLHRLGRYAPWEPEFDFTPPRLGPGEEAGPPDFVGIGVQKAGTTWWHRLVQTHPGIWSPPGIHKERHFLDRFATTPFGSADIERYHGWFPRRSGTLAGEWTPDYFTFPWAPALLKQAAPDARLLLLLRDPIERLRSGLAHQRRMGSSEGAMSTADAVQRGFYHRSLLEWLDHFDPAQLLILQYERCALDPEPQLQATFRFLGLPEAAPAPIERARSTVPEGSPGLDPEVTQRLAAIYESDVSALAERLPRLDLMLWPNFSYLAGAGPPSDRGPNSPTSRP